jgi:hypothetical protein
MLGPGVLWGTAPRKCGQDRGARCIELLTGIGLVEVRYLGGMHIALGNNILIN